MYATIHEFRSQDSDVRSCLPPGARPIGLIALDDVQQPGRGTAVALWDDEPIGEGRSYRVTDQFSGRSTGRRPLFAQVTWLNGDGDPARADAAEHGGRHRIWPAVQQIEGIVDVFALRSADDRIVVIGLATGTETYEQVQAAVLGSRPLPDEDPALLRGADRIDQARVLFAELPSAVRS